MSRVMPIANNGNFKPPKKLPTKKATAKTNRIIHAKTRHNAIYFVTT